MRGELPHEEDRGLTLKTIEHISTLILLSHIDGCSFFVISLKGGISTILHQHTHKFTAARAHRIMEWSFVQSKKSHEHKLSIVK